MKFSILIANYNNGKYFQECYQSLLSQDYPNWEAVILDDCSTDNSVEVMKNIFKDDARFRFYQNEKNEGVGFTKGKLIELAQGEICGFVDPDDAILPTAIKKATAIFEKEKDVVLTYSRLIKCDENLQPLAENKSANQIPNGNRYFFNCPIVINHFVCFRRKTYFETEKIDPNLKISEDQDLYLKLYERGKVRFIDDANYLYRFHAGGISQNDNKQKSREFWGEVIFKAMKRRNLKVIHGRKTPQNYRNSEEIFELLHYQNSIPYRIKKKLIVFFQNFF
ncbi:glycosyltransferase family 2 protein [Chryseobacterium sp. R2A-55]|uniref:glycosyltransferase family 2 protein n=1 Tax=Chryseobacterium sp. R2A-55 TaxID=2744445 RepID=UPI001F442450|nr:glycosyltransferase [Chryseobacterium sp. R2A-55]